MSQEDSGVHSDGSYPTSERKHSTPVTAKELKITWNYCFEDNNEDFLVEQEEESIEKERLLERPETKARRRSNHLCSNLGRRRRSSNEGLRRRSRKDDGGRRNKDGRRGRRSKDESESQKVIPPWTWVKSSKARIVTNLYKIHTHQKIHIIKKITRRHELHHPFIPVLIISTVFQNHSSRNYGQPMRQLF